MLDIKDKKLLYELDLNARLSIRQLSKKIGLSQEATRYRLGRLQQKRVVLGFVTYLNFVKLGYFGYAVYCRYSNITEEKKQELKSFLKKHEKIYWIAEYGGRFDLSFSIFAKNPREFDETLTSILSKFSNFLTSTTLITKLEPNKYPRDYLLEKKRTGHQEKIDQKAYPLTKIEEKILQKLTTNARITAAEIAREINKPLSTVIYGIKKLEKNNIIGGYTSILDPTSFGYQAFQLNIITQNITEEKIKKILAYCEYHPNIILAIKVLGDWNIEIIYEVENAKKMQECIIELRNNFSDIIKDIELLNFFEDYIKLNHYPFKISQK
ncbi:Lrp/AsnC family transcriptional regulator [Candidatus Woesearchaeota archaeon]|nr:Lrp/AsnC family transcriptional regulator [Candidatus Woesearchaeota archaeon]